MNTKILSTESRCDHVDPEKIMQINDSQKTNFYLIGENGHWHPYHNAMVLIIFILLLIAVPTCSRHLERILETKTDTSQIEQLNKNGQ